MGQEMMLNILNISGIDPKGGRDPDYRGVCQDIQQHDNNIRKEAQYRK